MTTFTWAKKGGYECSSNGDKRFSAFHARMHDGRTIEHHYQCDPYPVGKGYDPGGRNWKLGKGKKPLDPRSTPESLYKGYIELWRQWAIANPHLMMELRSKALEHNCVLSDMFASTPVNQAHALVDLLNEGY